MEDAEKKELKEIIIKVFLQSSMIILVLIIVFSLGYYFGTMQYAELLSDPVSYCNKLMLQAVNYYFNE